MTAEPATLSPLQRVGIYPESSINPGPRRDGMPRPEELDDHDDAPAPPDAIKGERARALYAAGANLRREVNHVASNCAVLRDASRGEPNSSEAIAEVTLAFRHLEDAGFRLGKALQVWERSGK